ncbi:hypothetical protein NPS01_17940 [Nocardioides psychrotolerans]|uniref:DUF2442 domain-containing protein n=1 Tax=Nocardioides psychrotolerans TaxID=1005945 RepID=A0A1I3ITZ4_9ACTN|nr:DUF2442 domain-containing protein [Nocardioides psychrotolerans]GEP38131.1 hypothetical protein NPS01_17940 [Nocardioides psychrotolerans]SFI51411.1 Protein of unknown function [Nocardioides psychrotolerans]
MVQRAVDPALVVVTGVCVLGRAVLEVTFDTTEVKIIDMESLMCGPVFEPLMTDDNLFCHVRADAETGTIAWTTGAGRAPDELSVRSRAAALA